MLKSKGTVILEKIQFSEDEFVVGVSTASDSPADIYSPTFKKFLNICVGSPNLNKYKTAKLRDDRYELGKKMLLNVGYVIEEK